MRYHAKQTVTLNDIQWAFSEQDTPLAPIGMLLVRIMVGKVEDKTQPAHLPVCFPPGSMTSERFFETGFRS